MNHIKKGRIFVKTTPTDLRKGFTGLYALVIQHFKKDILDGDTFLFLNKQKNLIKMMKWDGTGILISSKRLAKGRFANIFDHCEGRILRLSKTQLFRLISGQPMQRLFLPQKNKEKTSENRVMRI